MSIDTQKNGIIKIDQEEFLRRAIGRLNRSRDPVAVEVKKMCDDRLQKLKQLEMK